MTEDLTTAADFAPGGGIRLIGHRGARGVAPENTLPALEHGVEVGADAIELDVHHSRDGVVVVIHDPTLERTTDGEGLVADRTLAELKELDAGFYFTPDDGRSYPFRGRGVRIPTIDEIVANIPEGKFLAVQLNVKHPGSAYLLGVPDEQVIESRPGARLEKDHQVLAPYGVVDHSFLFQD